MSQCEQVLKALEFGPITAIDALQRFGCFRLAARVSDLRQAGHHIETETVSENGKSFARYRLIRASN